MCVCVCVYVCVCVCVCVCVLCVCVSRKTPSPSEFSKNNQCSGDVRVENLQPFSVVRDVGFRHVMKALDPRYTAHSYILQQPSNS